MLKERGEARVVKIVVNSEACTGCEICALTCSFVKEGLMDSRKGRIYVIKPALTRTEVLFCNQCGNCIKECPEKALSFNEQTGAVAVDEGLCTGCGFCFDACPTGYLRGHPVTGYPLLCDLCRGEPECTKNCPTGAIQVRKE